MRPLRVMAKRTGFVHRSFVRRGNRTMIRLGGMLPGTFVWGAFIWKRFPRDDPGSLPMRNSEKLVRVETIIIGDIHGCSREFSALLDHVSPGIDDRLVLLGDLVNKGPDPAGVLETFASLNCLCLLGNHDVDHLRWKAGRSPKPETILTRQLIPPTAV